MRLSETMSEALVLVLGATLCAVACGAEDGGIEVASGAVKLDGVEYTKLLDLEHGRRLWASQQAGGASSVALKRARDQRAVVRHPVHGLLLGPPFNPHEHEPLPGQVEPPIEPPGRIVDLQGMSHEYFGTDNRYWPYVTRYWWGDSIQQASNAALAGFAFEIADSLHGVASTNEDDLKGRPSCGGTMVSGRNDMGDGSGMVGVTAAHCLPNGYNFWRGWTLPHSRTARVTNGWGTGPSFTCQPSVFMPGAWVYEGNNDYDYAVLNWAMSSCAASDNAKHNKPLWWANMDDIYHSSAWPPAGTEPLTATFPQVTNLGFPSTTCGTAPAASFPTYPPGSTPYPKWPTACGMVGTAEHYWGSNRLRSGDIDTSNGHSGSGFFTDSGQSVPNQLMFLGPVKGFFWCAFCPNYAFALVRNSNTNAFLRGAGVF